MARTGFIDILKPQFLVGVQLPEWLDEILSFLRIDSMEEAWDDSAVVYFGKAQFVGEGTAQAPSSARTPSGTVFQWEDVNIQFRMTVPRTRSDFIQTAVSTAGTAAPAGSPVSDINNLLNRLEIASTTGDPSDYPGVGFKIELLFSAISIHLPKDSFLPAKIAPDGWLVKDPEPEVEQVQITLPKIALNITQGDTIGDLDFDFKGWGVYGLDDPADPKAGELIKMTPPLCIHQSRVVGFGLERIVLDLSDSFTPPEILEQFGTGDEFRGLWIPHVRFFISTGKQTGFAFDTRANDLLIDLEHGFSGELAFDLIRRNDHLKVEPILYQGDERRTVSRGTKVEDGQTITVTNSRASVAADGELQLSITGGYPPYTIAVNLNGTVLSSTPFNGDATRPIWQLGNPGTGNRILTINVTDSSTPNFEWHETIVLELTAAGVSSGTLTTIPSPQLSRISGDDGYTIQLQSHQPDDNKIFLNANPTPVTDITVNGSPIPTTASNGDFSIDSGPGDPSAAIVANWTPPPVSPDEIIYFEFEVPLASQMDSEISRIYKLYGNTLLGFIQRAHGAGQGNNLSIEGNASFDGHLNENYNDRLSDRRAQVLNDVILRLASENGIIINSAPSKVGHGTQRARAALSSELNGGILPGCGSYPHPGTSTGDYKPECYRNAIISFTAAGTATVSVEVERPPSTVEDLRTPTERGPTPETPSKPPIFKSIGTKVRFQRNDLVLAEIHGQLDFRTAAENRAGVIQSSSTSAGSTNTIGSNIESHPGSTEETGVTPQDGIVDYLLQMSYDSAIKRMTYTLGLGFDKDQKDGFIHLNKFTPAALSNTFGSLLTFAPLIADSIDSGVKADGGDATAPIVLAAVEVGVAVALGLTGVFKMERITLYGAELNISTQLVDYLDFEDSTVTDLSVMFDYAIDFKIDLDLGIIKIESSDDKPLRVRYNALGFKLDFIDGEYIPVFDTSKGYEFAMADPGLLQVSPPFGNILKVVGARVSRVNPLNVEFDLAINANLGIVSVDQIKVKIPVDPIGVPTIIPTKATVNIPGTFVGTGYIDLSNGIKGFIDITIVPIKLRLAASIGINPIEADGRKATAFYLGLEVEFPAPIPVAGTGLGLYGVLGLFGMHYKRKENINADVPALNWLNSVVNGNPTDISGWDPNLDKWAFGIGAVLGTVDGGFTLNLKGMLVLELPGPRILIFVKLNILNTLPETKGSVESLGILAVVDLDFNLNKLTIGVLIAYEIKDLISLKIPVEAGFSFNNINDWNLYIGRISAPITAEVLGIVKAQGYFMIDGDKIDNFPGPEGNITLQGLAIAVGLKASIILGDESSGLYLKVTAGFDAGISFSPFHVYGIMELRGELRLFIISISAWATLVVEAPNPTYLLGEACGKVDFFFFSIKGCVKIKIGNKPPASPAPDLLSGMVLQSRSPALVLGQGSDRPIDGLLGNAKEVAIVSSATDNELIRVPIDAIPILKLKAPALQATAFTTFTQDLLQAPKLTTSGWIKNGENREVRYSLTSVSIDPGLSLDGLGKPPGTWISNKPDAKGIDTNIDLALLSWIPNATPRAIQRSDELTESLTQRWDRICDEIAPEACMLWTFSLQQLGYSDTGWHLNGIIWPDPQDTVRSELPNKRIHVYEDQGILNDPLLAELIMAEQGIGIEHAKVIGNTLGVSDQTGASAFSDMSITDASVFHNPRKPFGRVLELPFTRIREKIDTLQLPDKYKELAFKEPQRIVVDSGAVTQVRLLIAVHESTNLKSVVIRGYDEKENIIESLLATDILEVSGVNGGNLTPQWVDASGPWVTSIVGIMSYLTNAQNHLERYLLKWNPKEGVIKFDILVEEPKRKLINPPSLLLCAMEMCKLQERERFIHETSRRDAEIETVESALAGGQLRPLLEPDTRYTVSVAYKAEAREKDEDGDWNEGSRDATQRFTFMTDQTSPAKLNPWVLLISPYDNNPYHFTEDAVEIYFNDASAIQLYQKYGDTLKAVLRKANGDHPSSEPTIDLDNLEEVDASILTPFEETLRLITDNKGCIRNIESEKHRKFVLNLPLDRGTEYILDVEIEGAPVPLEASNPLFRTAFKTSRFSGMEELADIIRSSSLKHRRLENNLALLGNAPSDQDIETAFLNAGLEAIEPSKDPTITYLWQPSGDSFKLRALLIDAPEPLWRIRTVPNKVNVPSESGDMEHWIIVEQPYLRIEETTALKAVQRLVSSPGGTRTIVYLKNGFTEIQLSLVQEAIVLDGTSGLETGSIILETELPEKAPWEINEIID